MEPSLRAFLLGPILAVLLVAFVLTRPRVLAYVRGSSWLSVVAWWLVAGLPWVLINLADGFYVFGDGWFRPVAAVTFLVLLPLALLGLPLLALGGTVIWLASRFRKKRSVDSTARGA